MADIATLHQMYAAYYSVVAMAISGKNGLRMIQWSCIDNPQSHSFVAVRVPNNHCCRPEVWELHHVLHHLDLLEGEELSSHVLCMVDALV